MELMALRMSCGVLGSITNILQIFRTVSVNFNQCKRLADRLCVIGVELSAIDEGMVLDRNSAGGKALDGGSSSTDDPAFDELLRVLRKGEALMSSYRGMAAVYPVLTRTDNREAFQGIHQELDALDSQFQFEGLDGKYIGSASGFEGSVMLIEDAEKDLQELPKKLEELVRINEDPTQALREKPDIDLETLKQVVSEKSQRVGEHGDLPSYLNIDLSSIIIEDLNLSTFRELERQSNQDPKEKVCWPLARNASWLGCEFAAKVFKSGDQQWNKEQLLKEANALLELRHPHVIQFVGFGQDSEHCVFLMEKMDTDLQNFMKKNPRPFTRSEELDIITQIAEGMYYLHTQQYVHGDLKCSDILVKQSGDYLEVKIADFQNAVKLREVLDQAAFDIGCSTRQPGWIASVIEPIRRVELSTRRPRWMAPEVFKADVFSFGITCAEILSGCEPYHDGMKDTSGRLKQLKAGVWPELPCEVSEELRKLLKNCWESNPNNRPSFQSIREQLATMRRSILNPAIGTNKNCEEGGMLRLFKPEFIPEYLRIKSNDLKKPLRSIGSGASASVYEPIWLGCNYAKKRFESVSHIGIQHRDLKTCNILFQDCSAPRHIAVKIIDFGSSKYVSESETHGSYMGVGTRSFLAPDYDVDTKLKREAAAAQVMGFNNLKMPESVFGVALSDELNDDEAARKRVWNRNWSVEEIRAVLELREEALRVDVGSDIWDYVSENLWKNFGFDRASNSCEQQWDTLLKSYSAIRDHESKIHSGMSGCVSYWEMNEDERSNKKLLRTFDFEWCETIGRILTAKPLEEEIRSIQMDSKIEEIDEQSEDEGLSADSTATLESQSEVTADSHVAQTNHSHEPCYETNSNYAGRKRSAATVMEDDLISRIAPFVNKQIEDALKPLLSVLRVREEDEEKHREKLLAIEERKAGSDARENAIDTASVGQF